MTETNRNNSQGKSLLRWLVPNRRGILWIGSFVLIVFTIVQIGSIVWFGRHVRNDIGEQYYAQIKEFWQTEIVFPNDWKDVLQSDVLFEGDVNRLWSILQKIEKENPQITKTIASLFECASRFNGTLDQSNLDELHSLFPRFDEFYEEGMKWQQRLEATIRSGSNLDILPRLYSNDWHAPNTLGQLIHLKAASKAADGCYSEALAIHTQALPLHVKSPVTKLPDYAYNLIGLTKTVFCIESTVKWVKDRDSLQACLDALTEWRPQLFRMQKERMHLYTLFNRLNACNIPIQYGRTVKAKEYIEKMTAEQFPQKNLSFVLASMMLTGASPLENVKSKQPIPIEFFRPFVFTHAIEDYYNVKSYDIGLGSGVWNNEQFAIFKYDCLRLSIAGKLYALQTGRPPADSSDLVPKYFPEVINDPATNSPYRWDEKGQIISP